MSKLRRFSFRSCAAEAYGKTWQWRLAVAQDLSLRSVQSWAAKDDDRVPDDVYAHVSHAYETLTEDKTDERIMAFAQRLKDELGLNEHVIAAQLHRVADTLSPPEKTPRGAPPPKSKKPPKAKILPTAE